MQNDKGFKIRIADNKSGGIRLPIKAGFLEVNQVLDLSPAEFFHPSVQLAIQKNLAVVEQRMSEEDTKGKLYRSDRVQSMNVPQLGGTIHYNQKFFVPNDKLSETAVAMIIREKWIVPAEESLPEEKDITTSVTVPVKEEKTANLTKTKAVQSAKTASSNKSNKSNKSVKSSDKKIKGEENIPNGMHVHVPEGVRDDVSIRKIPKSDMILDVTKDSESEEISFVDQEQTNAKLKENGMENNEEVQ